MLHTLSLAGILLLIGSNASAQQDPQDVFAEMLEESLAEDLGKQSTEDLVEIVNKPGMTNATDDRLGGGEFNPLMSIDEDCLGEAIKVRTQMVGVEQAKRDIAMWQKKLENKEMSEYDFWKEVVQCKDYCAMIMIDTMSCYTDAAASRYRGIFMFDTGVAKYQAVTKGDRASGNRTHRNDATLRQIVAMMKASPKEHIMLEGRASPVGNDEANFRLSGHRSDSIRQELLNQGIAENRIHYRWIGEGEPQYRRTLARKYQIQDKYDHFGEQSLNQSVTVYVFLPNDG